MSLEDDIQQYLGYFKEQVESIKQLESPLFCKILYAGVIDTLGRAAFPTIQGHRQRVVQFIDSCSGWHDKDRVSAVQLVLSLEANQSTSGKLYGEMKSRVSSWDEWAIIRPNSDPMLHEAYNVAAQDEKKFVDGARYVELFYTYRNHLVHEFRMPGYGMEISNNPSTPYYHGFEGRPWQLVFPAPFFQRLCMGCLTGLESYLKAEQRNPYDSYEFGSLWRRR